MLYSYGTYLPARFVVWAAVILLGCVFWFAPHASGQALDEEPEIRVRLIADRTVQQVEVHSDEASLSLLTSPAGPAIAQVDPGTSVLLRARDGEIAVDLPDAAGFYAEQLTITTAPDASWRLSSPSGSFSDRTYIGSLFVSADGATDRALRIVNGVPLESYVASVVSSEYGFDDPEGARAMAVLARTYAMYNSGKFGAAYHHVDHTLSQVYRGETRITQTAREATEATRGQILTYEGEPIQAVYFSSSGGHTANNEDLWRSEAIPYLRGREDPYDEGSPHSEWEVTVNRSTLLSRLSRQHGFTVRGFTLGDRSADGRVQYVRLLGPGSQRAEVSGDEFRRFANQQLDGRGIRSTLFTATRDGDSYVFRGSGFGHGVGLSQYGALEMSRRGHSYDEILAFYFTGVSLATHDESTLLASPDDTFRHAPEEPENTEPEQRRSQKRIGW